MRIVLGLTTWLTMADIHGVRQRKSFVAAIAALPSTVAATKTSSYGAFASIDRLRFVGTGA